MEIYSALYDDSVDNVYAISLVEKPAMKGQAVRLSEQEVKLATVNQERREIMGLVLEPNKVIPRSDGNGGVYGIVFSDQTIRDLSRDFFKSKNNDKSTIEHTGEFIQDVSFVESWIVEDSEKDKSAAYGLNYPKGSWMATMKIDNDDVWNDYVETGKVTGFSIDSVLKFEKLNNVNMSEVTKEKTFKEQLGELKNELLTELKDFFKPKEEPKTTELSEDKKVEDAKEEPKEVVLSEEQKTKLSESIDLALEPVMKINTDLSAKIETLEADLKAEQEKVVELSKKPKTETIVQAPVTKSYSEMNNYERALHNRGKL